MALALLLPSLYSSSPAANRKCPNSRGLRPLFTLSQKEDRLCAVLRLPEGGVTLPGWLSDFTNAPFVRPSVAQSGGTVHRIGPFEITTHRSAGTANPLDVSSLLFPLMAQEGRLCSRRCLSLRCSERPAIKPYGAEVYVCLNNQSSIL